MMELISRLLNWISLQRYYAYFGDILPQIYVFTIDVLYYVCLLTLFYVIGTWILHPISSRRRSNAKQKQNTEIINLLTEQTLILLSIQAEIRKRE